MTTFKIWTEWYGYIGSRIQFNTWEEAYDFLVDYVGSEAEAEEMIEEGYAWIGQEA